MRKNIFRQLLFVITL